MGKIRDSNRTTLISQLKAMGLAPLDLGIAPDRYVSVAHRAGWPSGRDKGGLYILVSWVRLCEGYIYSLTCSVTQWPGEGKRRGLNKARAEQNTHEHTRALTHALYTQHTHTHGHTHTHTHAHADARTHARTNTHTHTPILSLCVTQTLSRSLSLSVCLCLCLSLCLSLSLSLSLSVCLSLSLSLAHTHIHARTHARTCIQLI